MTDCGKKKNTARSDGTHHTLGESLGKGSYIEVEALVDHCSLCGVRGVQTSRTVLRRQVAENGTAENEKSVMSDV